MPAPPPIRHGTSAIGRGFGVYRVDYTDDYHRPSHSHEESGITLVLSGLLQEVVRGTEEQAGGLSVVVKPAGTLHANQVGPGGARTLMVAIDNVRRLLPEDADLGRYRWCQGGSMAKILVGLWRALESDYRKDEIEGGVLELLGEATGVPAPAPGDAPHWVRRARKILDDEPNRPLEVRVLAGQLGVHPVSLTRAFRRAYGIPVTTYRRRARLRLAVDRLHGGEERLGTIAHDTGFADHAHMCREVRAATGLTPTELRLLART